MMFFCICIAFLLGIMALSFDMGRRASTQSDMQAFADNVALAAAGELNGQGNAIQRAKDAAEDLILAINEQLNEGTGVAAANVTITFDVDTDLVFYSVLPDRDTPARPRRGPPRW